MPKEQQKRRRNAKQRKRSQNVGNSARQNDSQIKKGCGNSSRGRKKPNSADYNDERQTGLRNEKRLQNAKRLPPYNGSRLAHQPQSRPPKMEAIHGEKLVHCRLQLLPLDPRAQRWVRKGLVLYELPPARGAHGRMPRNRLPLVLLRPRLLLFVQLSRLLMCLPRKRSLPKMTMVSKQCQIRKLCGALDEGGHNHPDILSIIVLFPSSLVQLLLV